MKAEEARKITAQHSKRMKAIYADIELAAKSGYSSTVISVGMASAPELDILRKNGYSASYETSEIDGGQFIVIKWE